MEIPFIFFAFLIAVAKASAHTMNIYGQSGHPCRTPQLKLKKPEDHPLLTTQL